MEFSSVRLEGNVDVGDVDVVDVGEFHFEVIGAASAVLEIDFLQSLGDDCAHLLVAGAVLLGVEEAGGVGGREVDGQPPDPAVVGGADGGGVAEAGAGFAAAAGSAAAGRVLSAGADAGRPA